MASLIKRRAPITIGPPHNTAGPNRFIPKICQILGRSVLTAGVVICVHPPHATASVVTKVPRKVSVVIGQGNTPKSAVYRIAPPKSTLPRWELGKIRVIGTSFNRAGYVVKTHRPKFVATTPSKPKKIHVLLTNYRRNGHVFVTRHAFRVVVPVTSVRPKPVNVVPDHTDKFRKTRLGGKLYQAGPKQHTEPVSTFVGILACINLTETWNDHFSSRGWASIQDQITAGYPIYIQPTLLNGSYEEVVDYGLVINNTIITVRFAQNDLVPSVGTVVKIATSLDDITYTPFVSGESLFSSTLRYVKYRLEFTATNDKALTEISNLEYLIDVHTEMDSGSVNALATDVNGTEVFFNKAYKSVDSITLTVASIEPVTAIYQFVSVPNPTSFFVYALDSTGNRRNYLISWKARGVV